MGSIDKRQIKSRMTLTLVPPTLPHLNAPTIRQLPNGLTIIAEHLPVEAVNLNIWLNVGSALESESINGMAHFLEHMVFKGTPKLPSGEFERLVEQQGAVMNAATSQDYTHFYITTAPKDFAKLAPLQWEVLLNPSIAEDPIENSPRNAPSNKEQSSVKIQLFVIPSIITPVFIISTPK